MDGPCWEAVAVAVAGGGERGHDGSDTVTLQTFRTGTL